MSVRVPLNWVIPLQIEKPLLIFYLTKRRFHVYKKIYVHFKVQKISDFLKRLEMAAPASKVSVSAALCLKIRLFYHVISWIAVLRQHKISSCM